MGFAPVACCAWPRRYPLQYSTCSFSLVNHVYKRFFGQNPPSRVCVESGLPSNCAVQMEAAAFPEKERKAMHVQSLSHWAPANIGPYSQTVQVGERLFVSGQIALVPATLEVIEGGILAECRLSIRHVRRLLASQGGGLGHVFLVVCYVTHRHHINVARREWNWAHDDEREEDGTKLASWDAPCFDEYVVVSALPRAAQVEWQVYADLNNNLQWKYETLETNLENMFLTGLIKWVESTRVSLLISVESADDTVVSAATLLRVVLQVVDSLLLKAGFLREQLSILRTFYKQDVLNHWQLNEAASKDARESSATNVSVMLSFIPILRFENRKQICSVVS